MKDLSAKLRIIYKPFLAVTAGFILTYTFLNWLLFIKGGISIKEEVVNLWLPLALPWIPILIWLRPRIKLLQFKKDNGGFALLFLAGLIMAAPTMIAQAYLETATGKLTALDNITQFGRTEKTKYYSIKNLYIDKQHIAVRNTANVSGKHNEDFNMLIYVAMPVLKEAADTTGPAPTYWLGKRYFERISNRLSDQEKDEKYKAFTEKSQQEFNETDFNKFTYLEVMGNTNEHDEYNTTLKKISAFSAGNNIVFEAKTTPFADRNGTKLPWVFGSLGIGMLVFFIILLFPGFKEQQLTAFKSGKKEPDTILKEVFDFFVPKEGFFVTPIIIDLNILVYIIMVFAGLGFVSFKGADLLNWGANFKPYTTDGQWWRLLTSIFLHGGLMHILANMYALLFIGIFVEPLLGKKRYLLIYLVTGIFGSIASIWWHDATVSVGASGAIFGLYGFFLACLLLKVFPPDFGKAFLSSTLIFIGFNLVMGLTGGIDNAAHIGGLVSGFVLGLIMSGRLKQQAQLTE